MKSSLRIIYSLIVFILGIVLLSVLTVLLIYENRQTHLSFDQVNHTNALRLSLEKYHVSFNQLQLALTATPKGNAADTRSILHNLEANINEIDSLASNDALQKDNMIKLREHLKDAKAYAVTDQPNAELKSSLDISSELAGSIIVQMKRSQDNILERRKEFTKKHSILPAIIGIGISIFSIIIFTLAFYFINAELKKTNHLNNELEAKNVQLEKYTRELRSFTDITSHDMQEPLRKIELFISLIEEREKTGLTPKALHYFDKVKESVARMRQLFFSILNFNLADETQNAKEDVDLNEVLRETLDTLKVYIRDTNAVVNTSPLPYVQGIRTQLIQLFQNILSNALKYKRQDVVPEITVSYQIVEGKNISVRDLRKDVKYYRIDFRDNGIGFDQKYVDKIFGIFQRHVRNEGNGVGIGLSICRKIAQNHAGTMTAESEMNKGSLFSFYIPVGG
jgi:signal transduction histidine kinase